MNAQMYGIISELIEQRDVDIAHKGVGIWARRASMYAETPWHVSWVSAGRST
jgi:hypothetical protein